MVSRRTITLFMRYGLMLLVGSFIDAQEPFLMDADFHVYDEARGASIVRLGEEIRAVIKKLGPPVTEDQLPDLSHSALLFYDGLRITYHPGLQSVAVLTIQGDEYTTYRGLRVGDCWHDAETMYPRGMFRHDSESIYGSLLVPRVPIDDEYFIHITRFENNTVGSIAMGFAVP